MAAVMHAQARRCPKGTPRQGGLPGQAPHGFAIVTSAGGLTVEAAISILVVVAILPAANLLVDLKVKGQSA